MGVRSVVRRSTLADANESRNWRIWSDLSALLIHRTRELYANDAFGIDLDNTVYALDSCTIAVCPVFNEGLRSRRHPACAICASLAFRQLAHARRDQSTTREMLFSSTPSQGLVLCKSYFLPAGRAPKAMPMA